MMRTEEIKRLLDVFYNGETTTEQEQVLLDYFKSNEVDEELIDEAKIFLGMHNTESIEVPDTLKSEIENTINKLDAEHKTSISSQKNNKKKRLLLWVGTAAASIALIVSATFYFNNKPEQQNPVAGQQNQQIENLTAEEKKALKEAEEALILLSSKFNEGLDQLAIVNSNLDKTNEILNKSFNRKNDKES